MKMKCCLSIIEEGLKQKQRQRSSRLFAGQIWFYALYVAGVSYEARRQVEEDGLAASLVEEVLASSPELANSSAADNPPEP